MHVPQLRIISQGNNALTIAVSKSHEERLPVCKTIPHLHILLQEFVLASRSSPLLDGSAQLEVFTARDFGNGRIGGLVDAHSKLSMWIGGTKNGSFECRQSILLDGADSVAQ